MEIRKGMAVSGGIAAGRLFYYRRKRQTADRSEPADVSLELLRFQNAREYAIKELQDLYEQAEKKTGADSAAIFAAHQMLLEDEEYGNFVTGRIEGERMNAEFAAASAGEYFEKQFSELQDEYMRARAADVRDVTDRLLRALAREQKERAGEPAVSDLLKEPVILAAEELLPSDTVQFDRSKLLGLVTAQGSVNCHMAILARSMSLPALTAVSVPEDWEGRYVILDGEDGTLYVDPDPETEAFLQKKREDLERRQQELLSLIGQEDITADGRRIRLYANVGNGQDIEDAIRCRAAGVGLFRSEFLYLGREDFPGEEEQFSAYRDAALRMQGKEVIIRTLDIGADKQAAYFGLGEEANPALGYRAVRICLTRTDIFKTQLRAIYRASAYGTVSIMFPMIASCWEVQEAKRIAAMVQEELRAEEIPTGKVSLGIMIETPAAAVMSDVLAKEVDFFSIGTNDLLQYTLAVDRQNERLEPFYDPRHPAVLRLIEMTVRNAHAAGCTVGICGEMGADPQLTETFLKMGVDELSVSPSSLLKIRKKIRETDLSGKE